MKLVKFSGLQGVVGVAPQDVVKVALSAGDNATAIHMVRDGVRTVAVVQENPNAVIERLNSVLG